LAWAGLEEGLLVAFLKRQVVLHWTLHSFNGRDASIQ
jgi:hypothetical protein